MKYKVEEYIESEKNISIKHLISQEKDGKDAFLAFDIIQIDTPQGVQSLPFQFEIEECETIDEAFDKFESAKERFIEQKRQEQKIITPNSANPPIRQFPG